MKTIGIIFGLLFLLAILIKVYLFLTSTPWICGTILFFLLLIAKRELTLNKSIYDQASVLNGVDVDSAAPVGSLNPKVILFGKRKPWVFLLIILSAALFILSFFPNEELRNSFNSTSNSSTSPSAGVNQWGEDKTTICRNFAQTRQDCATAANFSQCMDIKDRHRSPYNPDIAMWSSDQYSCEVDGTVKKY